MTADPGGGARRSPLLDWGADGAPLPQGRRPGALGLVRPTWLKARSRYQSPPIDITGREPAQKGATRAQPADPTAARGRLVKRESK